MNLPVIASCDGCGVCCAELGLPPFLDEIDFIPAELQEELAEVLRVSEGRAEDRRPCLWLDPQTRRCKHYEHRPNLCREYELGGDCCREARRAAGID